MVQRVVDRGVLVRQDFFAWFVEKVDVAHELRKLEHRGGLVGSGDDEVSEVRCGASDALRFASNAVVALAEDLAEETDVVAESVDEAREGLLIVTGLHDRSGQEQVWYVH